MLRTENATKALSSLNAYALDFYKHYQLVRVIDENMIRKHAWELLKDWMLTLQTMVKWLRKANAEQGSRQLSRTTLKVMEYLAETFEKRFQKEL